MEQRISLVTLGVRDLSRAQAFFERLGWRRSVRQAEGVAFFQTGGVVVALWGREDLAKDANLTELGAGTPPMSVALNVRTREEVDTTLNEAQKAGGAIVKPGEATAYGGYAGYFLDTEGFLWEIAWNPGFTIAEDGSIQLPP